VQEITFRDQGIAPPESIRPLHAYRDGFRSEGTSEVDADNDGKPDLLMQLSITSGYGRGCSANYFEILADDGTRLHPDEKSYVFSEFQAPYRAANCGTVGSRLFLFEDRIYYEGNRNGTGAPPHVVAVLEGSTMKEACKFQEKITTALVRVNQRLVTNRSGGGAGFRRSSQ
jgi:hypothetical protein